MSAEIVKALFVDAKIFTDSKSLDLAWAGIDYTPDGEFVKVDVLLGQQFYGLNAARLKSGILQYSIFTLDGGGIIKPLEIADYIEAYYTFGRFLNIAIGCKRVTFSGVDVAQQLNSDGYLNTPVSVNFKIT